MRDVIVMMMIIIVVIVAVIDMRNVVSFHVAMDVAMDSVAFGMNVIHVSFGGRSVEVIASTVDAR